MKHIQYFICLTFLMVLSGCSIDDLKPNNLLLEDTVIVDETSAVNVLNRIYNSGLRNRFYGKSPGVGGEGTVEYLTVSNQYLDYNGTANPSLFGFSQNRVLGNNTSIEIMYRDFYYNINLVNYFIEIVERGDANVDSTRKNQLIAEARFFRALSHFNLLRSFGQFYDLNSSLGVVVSLSQISSSLEIPRSTVQATYNSIVEDLQFAVNNCTVQRDHFYVSKTTARALLAKVQLYAGDYSNASINALTVINNEDGYSLSPIYSDIFDKRYGSETLLAAFIGPSGNEEGNQGNLFRKSVIRPTQEFVDLADAQDGILGNGSADFLTGYDPRFSFGFDSNTPGDNIGKYPNGILDTFQSINAIQTLRMGEVYLICAEAEARRSGGSLDNALTKLNDVRARAGVYPKELTDRATLLEDIRQEKVLELYTETAEDWFDLVRYHILGNIDALAVKPSLTSVNQFILPIPQNALLGNSLLVPNP